MFSSGRKSCDSISQKVTLFLLSERTFAKRGIPRRPRKKLRWFKPPPPRKPGTPPPDTSKTRTLSATPWGPPRYPIPRVEETSIEFHQNIGSLARIVKSKMGCLDLTVSHYTHSSKAALERLEKYGSVIESEIENIHLYQFVIVRDVLGYSRDMGSRNTLWIPDDFTINEFITYCKEECILDPKLSPLRDIDRFLNPYQPINWEQVSKIEKLDGKWPSRAKNKSTIANNDNIEWRDIEPIELLKLREKSRNTIMKNESYIDANDIFTYKHVPNTNRNAKKTKQNKDGRDSTVPEYNIPEESTHSERIVSFEDQVSDMHDKYRETMFEKQNEKLSKLKKHDRDILSIELNDNVENVDYPLSIEYDYDAEKMKRYKHKNNMARNIDNLRVTYSQYDDYNDYFDSNKNDAALKTKKYLDKNGLFVDSPGANIGGSIAAGSAVGGIYGTNASDDLSSSYMDNMMQENDGNASDLDENDSGDDEEDIEYASDSDDDNELDDDGDDEMDDGEETDYEDYDNVEQNESQRTNVVV